MKLHESETFKYLLLVSVLFMLKSILWDRHVLFDLILSGVQALVFLSLFATDGFYTLLQGVQQQPFSWQAKLTSVLISCKSQIVFWVTLICYHLTQYTLMVALTAEYLQGKKPSFLQDVSAFEFIMVSEYWAIAMVAFFAEIAVNCLIVLVSPSNLLRTHGRRLLKYTGCKSVLSARVVCFIIAISISLGSAGAAVAMVGGTIEARQIIRKQVEVRKSVQQENLQSLE